MKKQVLQPAFLILTSAFLAFSVLFSGNARAIGEPVTEATGQVKDKITKENIEYCSVRIFTLNDSLIAGGITNDKGYFSFPLDEGEYKLTIEFAGYKTVSQTVKVNAGFNFLGTFNLETENTELNEVTIKGKTKERNIDKEIVLVTSDMRTGATNTDDVLEKVQGVSYDRYNNTIKVDGNKNIVFLVNGLEKDPEYIRNISPDRLQKVEIIRDPSGRYALEGYAAIINIILKENYRGSEIFVDNLGLVDLDAPTQDNILAVDNFTGTYNYTYNKINFYTKLRLNETSVFLPFENKKNYAGDSSVLQSSIDENNHALDVFRLNANATLGLDYFINPKNIVSYEGNISAMPFVPATTDNETHISEMQGNSIKNEYFASTEDIENKRSNYHTLFYKGNIDGKNTVKADLNYANFNDNSTSKYFENNILISDKKSENTRTGTDFNVELEHAFNEKTSFNVGYGFSYKNTENKLSDELLDIPSIFEYSETRNKLFAYASRKLTKKIDIKLGAAGEWSKPETDAGSRDYFLLQPLGDIRWNLSDYFEFKLQYRSSGIYPDISEANPFTNVIDRHTVKTGNPYLDPVVIHKVSFRADIMQGLFSIEPYYHFSDNYITQTGTLRTDGIFEYTYSNAGKYTNHGIKGNLTIPFGKSLFLQSSLDFYKSSIEFNSETNEITDWTTETQLIYMNRKYQTVSGLLLQKNNSKHISAQGWNSYDSDFWLVFVQQPFLKNRLTIMLGYVLPLNFATNYAEESLVKTAQYTETQSV